MVKVRVHGTAEEKELKHLICKTISEATGTPIDFQEGHCANTNCKDCIFNNLTIALYSAGYRKTE